MLLMRTVAALSVLVGFTACANNAAVPECGGWRLATANAVSFGMYGISNCVGRGDAARIAADRHRDVDDCVAQGGDPAACRAAIYAPRQPTQITVRTFVR
jgi:hypothetical protein